MMLQDLEGTEVKCYCFKTETAPQNNEDRIVSFVLPFMFCLHIAFTPQAAHISFTPMFPDSCMICVMCMWFLCWVI